MKIKVIYLARLSEDLGKKEEILELPDSGLTIKDIFSSHIDLSERLLVFKFYYFLSENPIYLRF